MQRHHFHSWTTKSGGIGRFEADSIERIIEQSPVVRISRIDEYGCVWYDTSIFGPDGTEEEHSLIVYDDDTWERVDSSTD